MPRRHGSLQSEGAFQGAVGEAHVALGKALRLCQGDVSKHGRASTQGRLALRRVRKLSTALSLLDEVKGSRLLSGDPDLVSDEEASQRTRERLADRDERAEARFMGPRPALAPTTEG